MIGKRRTLAPRAMAAVAAVVLAYSLCLFSAYGGVITVVNVNDNGPGSLRQALADAQSAVDSIKFSTIGTITLTSGQLDVDKDITIEGPSTEQLVISSEYQSRIFAVQNGNSLIISNLTFTRGQSEKGGAIYNEGTTIMRNCTISDSKAVGKKGEDNVRKIGSVALGAGGGGAGLGGAIYSKGFMTLENITLNNNLAQGGNGGDNPSASGNGAGGVVGGGDGGSSVGAPGTAGVSGGGGGGGAGALTGDAGAGGSAAMFGGAGGAGVNERGGGGGGGAGLGGAIFIDGATVKMTNVTIAGNICRGGNGGSGWYDANRGNAGSGVGGGIFNSSGSISLNNTIIANNLADVDRDLNGTYISEIGHNFIQNVDNATLGGKTEGNITGQDPYLLSLTNNGGPAPTMALKSTSAARNAGTNEGAVPAVDQRYYGRAGATDMGAYEYQVAILTEPPAQQLIYELDPLVLTMTADGGSFPISYQWYKDDEKIIGETTNSYEITEASLNDTGNYRCEVKSGGNSLSTSDANVTVLKLNPPTITKSPESTTLFVGKSVTFSITAVGKEPITYQWIKDGVQLQGKTTSTLTIDPVTELDAGVYSCAAINQAGSTTSAGATLTVKIPAQITTQPVSLTKYTRQDATISVVARGSLPLTYQWRKSGVDLPGYNQSFIKFSSLQTTDAGTYTCFVKNAGGSEESKPATLTVKESATIDKQPESVDVFTGQKATFSVEASGEAPITYQWKKNGFPIIGETSSQLVINSVTSADAASYSCTASNAGEPDTSALAKLTVLATVKIVSQPTSITVFPGKEAVFNVVCTGATPITYQWYKDGNIVTGADKATLTISSVSKLHEGSYYCVCTNGGGSETSSAATLTLLEPPIIVKNPESLTRYTLQSATFSVEAVGTEPLTYKWKKDGVFLFGQTSSKMTIAKIAPEDAGKYSCEVTNGGGSAESTEAELQVLETVHITTQPIAQEVYPGQTATFTIEVRGNDPITYRWRKDGLDISGANTPTLTIEEANSRDIGVYSCVVANGGGVVISEEVSLTLLEIVHITKDPVSISVASGGTAAFTIKAEGTAPITYQWKKDDIDIVGATLPTLILNYVSGNDAGTYTCVAKNDGGSDTSEGAVLDVEVTLTMAVSEGGYSTTPSVGGHVVMAGSTQKIAALADAGYHFVNWTIQGAAEIGDVNLKETEVVLTDHATVTANFEPNIGIVKFTLEAAPTNTGETEPSIGYYAVNIGEPQKIVAIPIKGFHFINWSVRQGEAKIANPSMTQTTVVLETDAIITANFGDNSETVEMTINVSPPNAGTTNPALGTYSVYSGEPQVITAEAEDGFHFVKWTADGATIDQPKLQTTTVTLDGDATITANFEENTGTAILSVKVSPENGGTTNPGVYDYEVNIGEPIQISATSTNNYHFLIWKVEGDAEIDDDAAESTVVTLAADTTVTAVFAHDKAILTMAVSPANMGIVIPSEGAHEIDTAVPTDVSATASEYYRFVKWSTEGNIDVEDEFSAKTSVQIYGNATLTANFVRSTGTANLSVSYTPITGGGAFLGTTPTVTDEFGVTTSAKTSKTVTVGEATSITAVPREGYTFTGWLVKGSAAISDSLKTTTSVKLSGNSVITANFANKSVPVQLVTKVEPAGVGTAYPSEPETLGYGEIVEVYAQISDVNYIFSHWKLSGNSIIDDNFSSSTTIRVNGNTTATAVFIDKSLSSILTQKVSGGSGSVGHLGVATVPISTPIPIEAVPFTGYVFLNWEINGNGEVEDPYAANTTVTLRESNFDGESARAKDVGVTVTAIFAETIPVDETHYLNVKLRIDNRKTNCDSVTIRNAPMTQKYFNPSYNTVHVTVDGHKFSMNGENGVFIVVQDGVSYASRDKSIRLKMNLLQGLWNFSAVKTDLSGVDNQDGIDIVLSVDEDHHGINLRMDEQKVWQFDSKKNSSTTTEVTGEALGVFDISKVVAKSINYVEGKDKLSITNASVAMPNGAIFDADNDSITISIDDFSFIIPGRALIQKSFNKFFYQDTTQGIRLNLDLNKNKFAFRLSNSNIWTKITPDDGLQIYMTLGDCEGGRFLSTYKRTSLKYSNKAEIDQKLKEAQNTAQ